MELLLIQHCYIPPLFKNYLFATSRSFTPQWKNCIHAGRRRSGLLWKFARQRAAGAKEPKDQNNNAATGRTKILHWRIEVCLNTPFQSARQEATHSLWVLCERAMHATLAHCVFRQHTHPHAHKQGHPGSMFPWQCVAAIFPRWQWYMSAVSNSVCVLSGPVKSQDVHTLTGLLLLLTLDLLLTWLLPLVATNSNSDH